MKTNKTSRWVICCILVVASCQTIDAPPEELTEELQPLNAGFELPQSCMGGFTSHIRINTSVLSRDHISISLFDGENVIATSKHKSSEGDQDRRWIGEVAGYPGSTVAITQHQGTISGNISFGGQRFQINRFHNEDYIICKVDTHSLPSGCSSIPIETDTSAVTATAQTSTGSNTYESLNLVATANTETRIDLMLLYTTASRQRYGKTSLEAKLINAVETANQAYRNSLIPIKLKLVHMAEVDYSESSDINKTLDHLQNKTDGRMDEIHSLRDRYGADLVSLIGEKGRFCGWGNTMTTPTKSFAPFAFSVVRSDCLDNHTLAHELGHNQGNVHNRDNTNKTGSYPYSHGHRRCTSDGTGFRTIMSYPCGRGDYINYFSNPKVSYGNFPTGIDHGKDSRNSADAAKSMRNTASIVAAFRDSSPRTTPPQAVPSAPSNLSATALSRTSIRLRWKDNSKNESNFKIERKNATAKAKWKQIATVPANSRSFRDRHLRAGSSYKYRIRAHNENGPSSFSNQVTETTRGGKSTTPPPTTPPPTTEVKGDFNWSRTAKPGTIEFNASSSTGNIVSYRWDFGDGSTGTGKTESHTYKKAGKYTVTLRVTDGSSPERRKTKTVTPTF